MTSMEPPIDIDQDRGADALAELKLRASQDELTGLPNRAAFRQRLDAAIARADSDDHGVALLCIGFDKLGPLLDKLSHSDADQLLAAVAQRLQRCLGAADTLARHGSHAFVLLAGDIVHPGQVAAIGAQVLAVLAAPFTVGGQMFTAQSQPVSVGGYELHLYARVGSAAWPRDSADGAGLLHCADMALAQARAGGAERYAAYSTDMSERALALIRMQAALHMALANNELRLSYQPVVDLQDGALCALGAVLRWRHPDMGEVEARDFMPVADDAGLSRAIGEWALRRALTDMRDWQDSGLEPPRVALAISARQFGDRDLAARVASALDDAAIAPALLTLEVTEAVLMHEPEASADTLDLLKALGIGLALDGIGAGTSSPGHLKRFPLDRVGIDRALTARLLPEGQDAALVTTIIDTAHHVGLRVVAKGVDSEALCDFLRRNMCDQVQGDFLGPAVDAASVPRLLRADSLLAPHLLRIQQRPRTLLLVDDEQNIVSALKRLLRRDGYQILTAGGGREGLEVLAAHSVDVIVSDQRMPGMLGADFLRAAKDLYPETLRIMLSGYTELQSVTDAVNEGAIYKFLTKPWDDDGLRGHIADAFRIKETADENERLNLALRTANHEMALTNRRMEELLRQNQQQIARDGISLNIARELLEFMPLPVIGLDDDGMVAFVNAAAEALFRGVAILGAEARYVLPQLFDGDADDGAGAANSDGANGAAPRQAELDNRLYQVVTHPMGARSASRGSLITLSPLAIPVHPATSTSESAP
ncbi:MAG: EAL domain-containing protein [Massilia sp.]